MKNFLLILSALIVAAHTNYPVVQSCDDVYKSGPYTLKTGDWEVELECDAETDGGGWHTILVRRGGENFYKNWRTYADDGIGSPETEYFLPLNFLHYLTSEDTYELLVEMREGREYSWALYQTIHIASEQDNFKLSLGDRDSAGNAGDSLNYHNYMPFSTYDQDNDNYQQNCAEQRKTAGWMDKCFRANLFGEYGNDEEWQGVVYNSRFGSCTSIDYLTLKLRKSKCVQGFGSSCAQCYYGFYLPNYPLYQRLTCLRECDIPNCESCSPTTYAHCKKCEAGYTVNSQGSCEPNGHTPPNGEGENTPSLKNCNINIYNYNSRIENMNVKTKEGDISLNREP